MGGDEWSSSWGDAHTQWHGTLYPRIKSFIPAQTILEIAPGFGRWTQFLAHHCEKLIIVDLSSECIEYCKKRFAHYSHIEYHTNDGMSLAMIENNSVDFVFSFDSLVHAEYDVIQSYIIELSKKFKENGSGFIHHSNIGSYQHSTSSKLTPLINRLIKLMKRIVGARPQPLMQDHWRAKSVTQEKFSNLCNEHGLKCLRQEIVNWGNDPAFLIDCFSVFCKEPAIWKAPTVLYKNKIFMNEADALKKIFEHYNLSKYKQ
jgi:2-polyprenyl-3-methyl-5-hydroxy-6-metoxy-1,4-benzoquinol methylase